MEIRVDNEWCMQPLKGDTGKAFVGMRAKEKVFIKRNTTPMLAALSKEGIAPKLVWTKRTGSGDVLTAQEWLDGRILQADEIGKRNDVIDVLYHLHHSPSLKSMLQKTGGQLFPPELMLQNYCEKLPKEIAQNSFLQMVIRYLHEHIPLFDVRDACVVHGDVNYKNWIVCQNYLYLVDWDSIMFADPAVDIATILGSYVPVASWSAWLLSYGIEPESDYMEKIYWYALLSILQEIKKNVLKSDYRQTNHEIIQLKRLYRS